MKRENGKVSWFCCGYSRWCCTLVSAIIIQLSIIYPMNVTLLRILIIFLTSLFISHTSGADTAQQLFSKYADRLYQIKVIEKLSSRKSAIGSGFLVRADGLMVTNYHVISKYIHDPDKYYLEALSVDNKVEAISVEDIDVVNDLALVRFDGRNKPFLELTAKALKKGDPIFSMGNPLDLGAAVVPGTYNGFTKQSFYQRIHFTGSINPGMSGGPVLNSRGKVMGVNVATAGNQIGFLVVAEKLLKLLADYQGRGGKPVDYQQRIREQLLENQRHLMNTVLSADWKTISLGDARVLNEIVPFIPCWGDKGRSGKDKERFITVSISCMPKETIYLNHGFTTGKIEVQYRWAENISLTSLQFSSLMEKLYGGAMPGNRARKEDITEYACHEGFVAKPDSRTVLCARAYKKYSGLFDILYISTTVGHAGKGLISHFTLSGVEQETAMRFIKRFMEAGRWN